MDEKRYLNIASIMALCLLLISGCSSANKEGDADAGTPVVAESNCTTTCHKNWPEDLTNYIIVDKYALSVHNAHSIGCQDCHGAGAVHLSNPQVYPIAYPRPNYVQCAVCHNNGVAIPGGDTSSMPTVILATNYQLSTAYSASKHLGVQLEPDAPCNRCHTHQGAVLSVMSHFTGDGTVMAGGVGAPGTVTDPEPIKCNTCHETHDSSTLRVDTAWDPSTTVGSITSSLANPLNDQFRLCTQCHGYINPAGLLMASGTGSTAPVGQHENQWYKIIATTHYDNPATTAIEGYGIRFTLPDSSVNPSPCFDCHGHEAKTNTNSGSETIHTDWAKSGHAQGLLTAKLAAAATQTDDTTAQVDAVMAASVTGGVWNGHNGLTCNRCHNATGFVGILATPAGTSQPTTTIGQVLACWACHSNAAAGTLRTLAGTKTDTNYKTDPGWNPIGYTLAYGKTRYPDMAASNLCIVCHDSRTGTYDPGSITSPATIATEVRPHNLQTATTMFVKMGFIAFKVDGDYVPGSTTVTYWNSLKSVQDGGTIYDTHRQLGTPDMIGQFGITSADTKLISNGPCATCHFSGSHSQQIDQRAIDAVCSKCHTSALGHSGSIADKTDFDTYYLEPQREAHEAAIKLAMVVFNDLNSSSGPVPLAYRLQMSYSAGTRQTRVYKRGTTSSPATTDWDQVATALGYEKYKLLGAVSNIAMFSRAGFVHARTYSRRLIYDSIDYLDDGVINNSVSGTSIAKSAASVTNTSTSIIRVGTLATFTAPALGFAPGDTVTISGATPVQYNGTFVIVSAAPNTFTYTMLSDPGSSATVQGSFAGTPVSGLYGKGATAFTNSSLTALAPGTTEAMLYLIGWSSTTGAWINASQVIGNTTNISERP